MIVYKYLRPERIDVLKNSLIRFTQPAALNDPFESLWILDKNSLDETIKTRRLIYKFMFGRDISDEELLTSIKEQVLKLPDEFSKIIGLLSFSKKII